MSRQTTTVEAEILWDEDVEARERPPERLLSRLETSRAIDPLREDPEEIDAWRNTDPIDQFSALQCDHSIGQLKSRYNSAVAMRHVLDSDEPGRNGGHDRPLPDELWAKAFGMYCVGTPIQVIADELGISFSSLKDRIKTGRWPELRELERNQRLAERPDLLRISESTRAAMRQIHKIAKDDPRRLVPGFMEEIERLKEEHLKWIDEQLKKSKGRLDSDMMSQKFLSTHLANVSAIDKLARKRLDMEGGSGPRNVLLAQHLNVTL